MRAVGRRPVRSDVIARRLAPSIVAGLVAIAAAAAGFHEIPNLFQVVSTVLVALLAALTAATFKKNSTSPHNFFTT